MPLRTTHSSQMSPGGFSRGTLGSLSALLSVRPPWTGAHCLLPAHKCPCAWPSARPCAGGVPGQPGYRREPHVPEVWFVHLHTGPVSACCSPGQSWPFTTWEAVLGPEDSAHTPCPPSLPQAYLTPADLLLSSLFVFWSCRQLSNGRA